MIAGGLSDDYVQSRFVRWYNHAAVYFNEASADPCLPGCFQQRYGSTANDGETHTYGEGYDPSCGCDYSKIDGVVDIYTKFNPYNDWTSAWGPQFFGETVWLESDMPGNSASPTDFSDLQYQWDGNNQFANYPCNQLSKQNDMLNDLGSGEG